MAQNRFVTKILFLFMAVPFFVLPQTACGSEEETHSVHGKFVIIKTKEGFDYLFDVELALTREQMSYGLMNRTELGERNGMLFLFDNVAKRSFWMKDTLIPLDIIFIEPDGEIQHIHHNARPQDPAHITSPHPVQAVLEINGGLSEKLGISEGDFVRHPAFRNTLAP